MKKPEIRTHLRPKAWAHSTASRMLTIFANTFSDVHVNGLHNVPKSGGVIVVANHRSYFDAIALASVMNRTKRDAMVLAKSELFNTPLKARLLRQVGTIPVYRGTANAVDSLQEAINSLRHGEMVVLFPEGTIPVDGQLMEFKTGAARMALAAQVPVVVVAMVGTNHVIASNLKKVKRRLTRAAFRPATIEVQMSEPLTFEGSPEDRELVDKVTDELYTTMKSMLQTMEDDMENIRMGKKEVGLLLLLATPVVGRIASRMFKRKSGSKS